MDCDSCDDDGLCSEEFECSSVRRKTLEFEDQNDMNFLYCDLFVLLLFVLLC